MDMKTRQPALQIFHLSGKRQGEDLQAIEGLQLLPALLAPYRDLAALRHDFPLVLLDGVDGPDSVRSLSALVDAMLREVAPRGIEGERLRRHALQLETEIRRALAGGAAGRLSELWEAAAARLGEREGETLEQVLLHAASALHGDGEVLACTQTMPARLLAHVWRAAQKAKARQFHTELSGLMLKLSDILRAAHIHSEAGTRPDSLKAALGGSHRDAFDFDVLSRIVGKGVPQQDLPPSRRQRLQQTLAVLRSQRFFAPDGEASGDYFNYVYDNCADAAQAYGQRAADAALLVKALSVAELEAAGRYVEAEHDPVFESFDVESLTAADLARFPEYLVCIPPERNDAPENAGLLELLSNGLPIKVLVQTSSLLEGIAIGGGHFAFGVRSARLATAAMGLGGMFVLQSTSSNLYAMRARIEHGLGCAGPALFSVYACKDDSAAALPAYLSAAAAMQSRAFPAFSYDAAAGSNWATRFSLENNPQPEDNWPVESLDFCDGEWQRAQQPYAFSFADFVLCDRGQGGHFARVPPSAWKHSMLPAAEWLALDEAAAAERVPYVLAVDEEDRLHRLIVDAKVMQAARRCLLLWQRLQEHGGVHDAYAERLLAKERAAWAASQAAAPAPVAVAVEVPGDAPAAAPAHTRDDAWIETARCPSCNECQLINDRMFGYDERKQAYIKDLSAGSYRQLVEAAESCQVAIIHPGKPRDPNEPGLEELLARAEPFR
ncbi:MAG: hypothetical protein AB7E72_02650 [Lysobacterales bacterium]